MKNNPWKLYDALIEGVDPSWKVDYYSQGVTWCEVFSGDNTGIAMCMHERGPGSQFPEPVSYTHLSIGSTIPRLAASSIESRTSSSCAAATATRRRPEATKGSIMKSKDSIIAVSYTHLSMMRWYFSSRWRL